MDTLILNYYINKMNQKFHSKKGPQFEDIKKILCAYHDTEFLTNFCVDKSCLMPLCPSCIVEHTEEHYRDNSKPLYMNLHEALHDARESSFQSIMHMEDCSKTLRSMKMHRSELLENLRGELEKHKKVIFSQINRIFEKFEKQIFSTIIEEEEKARLFDPNVIESNEATIGQAITELYERIGILKGEQCLSALIMFYGEGRKEIEETKNRLDRFISDHEQKRIKTRLNDGYLQSELTDLIEKSIEVHSVSVKEAIVPPSKVRSTNKYHSIGYSSPQQNGKYIRNSNTSNRKSRIFEEPEYSPSRIHDKNYDSKYF